MQEAHSPLVWAEGGSWVFLRQQHKKFKWKTLQSQLLVCLYSLKFRLLLLLLLLFWGALGEEKEWNSLLSVGVREQQGRKGLLSRVLSTCWATLWASWIRLDPWWELAADWIPSGRIVSDRKQFPGSKMTCKWTLEWNLFASGGYNNNDFGFK